MGTIAKTSIGDWLDRIDSTRNTLIESTKSGNRIASAFAMAEARCELIDSLKDESIRAKLLRITDPEIAMVELANNPTPDDRIRVCAIAILSGFTPGSDEFAVFGGGKAAGKLYVKERGFRVLFSHLGIVPEVRTTHPEYVPFGVNGKKVWRVGGSASATYQGKEYAVEFEGDKLLGIPGYDSDNVAGVSAKARRRILQALWVKVSPILTADHVDDDVETVPIAAAKVIDAPVAETTTPAPREKKPKAEPEPVRVVCADEMEMMVSIHKDEGAAVLRSLDAWPEKSLKFGELWDDLTNAKTATNVKAAGVAISATGDMFSDEQKQPLRDWYSFRMDCVTGKVVKAS